MRGGAARLISTPTVDAQWLILTVGNRRRALTAHPYPHTLCRQQQPSVLARGTAWKLTTSLALLSPQRQL